LFLKNLKMALDHLQIRNQGGNQHQALLSSFSGTFCAITDRSSLDPPIFSSVRLIVAVARFFDIM